MKRTAMSNMPYPPLQQVFTLFDPIVFMDALKIVRDIYSPADKTGTQYTYLYLSSTKYFSPR